MTRLGKRTLIGIIFVPILLFIYYLGGLTLQIFVSLLTILGVREFVIILKKKGINIHFIPVLVASLIINWFMYFFNFNNIIFLYIGFCIFIISYDIFSNNINQASERAAYSMFILIYIPLLLEFIYLLRQLENGRFLLIFLVILVWITDTGAYFVGVKCGKHSNIFKSSKKKSVEGFIGGFVTAFIFTYIGAILIYQIWNFRFSWNDIFAYTVIVGIFGQVGDLMESILKRDFNIKDFSNLLSEHGGILDRFDSIMTSAPLLYCYFTIIR